MRERPREQALSSSSVLRRLRACGRQGGSVCMLGVGLVTQGGGAVECNHYLAAPVHMSARQCFDGAVREITVQHLIFSDHLL